MPSSRCWVSAAVFVWLVGCGSHGGPYLPLAPGGNGGNGGGGNNHFVPFSFDAGVFTPGAFRRNGLDTQGAVADGLHASNLLDQFNNSQVSRLRSQDMFVFVPTRSPLTEIISETRVDELWFWDEPEPFQDTVTITGLAHRETTDPTYLLEERHEVGLDRDMRVVAYQQGQTTAYQEEGLTPSWERGNPAFGRTQTTYDEDPAAHTATGTWQNYQAVSGGWSSATESRWTHHLNPETGLPITTISDGQSLWQDESGYWVLDTYHYEDTWGEDPFWPADPNDPWANWVVISTVGNSEETSSDGTRWVTTYEADGTIRSEYYGPHGEFWGSSTDSGDSELWYDSGGDLFDDTSDGSTWYEDGGYVYTNENGYQWVDQAYFGDSPHFVWDAAAQQAVPTAYADTPHLEYDHTSYWIPDLNGWLWVADDEVNTVPQAWYDLYSGAGGGDSTDDGGWVWADGEYQWVGPSYFGDSNHFVWNAATEQAQQVAGYAESLHAHDDATAYWTPDLDGWLWVYDNETGTLPQAWQDLYFGGGGGGGGDGDGGGQLPSGGWVYSEEFGFETVDDDFFAGALHFVWEPAAGEAQPAAYADTPHLSPVCTAYWIPDLNGWLWVDDVDWSTVPDAWRALFPSRDTALGRSHAGKRPHKPSRQANRSRARHAAPNTHFVKAVRVGRARGKHVPGRQAAHQRRYPLHAMPPLSFWGEQHRARR